MIDWLTWEPRSPITPRWLHAQRIGDSSHWPAVISHHALGGLARWIPGRRVRNGYEARPGFGLLRSYDRDLFLELVWWLYLPALAWRRRWDWIALLIELHLVEGEPGGFLRDCRPIGWRRFTRAWRDFWIAEAPE